MFSPIVTFALPSQVAIIKHKDSLKAHPNQFKAYAAVKVSQRSSSPWDVRIGELICVVKNTVVLSC